MLNNSSPWLSLGQGLIGSAFGTVIESVGVGLSTLVNTPRVTFRVLRSLWRTEALGPVLKSTLTPTALVAGVLAPAVGVLAGALHGLYIGFAAGAEDLSTVLSTPTSNVWTFHSKWVDEAIEDLEDTAMAKPTRVYEIRIIEAIRGLITGTLCAVVTGVLIAESTLLCMPGLIMFALRMVFESGMLPVMIAVLMLAAVTLTIGPALVVLLAVIFGLGAGAARGYKRGLFAGLDGALEDCGNYFDAVCKVAYK